MTTNIELIARVREQAALVRTDPRWPTMPSLLDEVADALAAVSAPVEVTERERLIAVLREYLVTADGEADSRTIADAILAAGFRAPAADDETEWEYRIVDGDRIMYTDTVSRMMRAKLRGADVRRRRKAVNVPAGPWVPVESEEGAS